MAEPFATIPEVIVEEILLRLPSWASLVRAALVSKHWCGVISRPAFLVRYRELHPSSPLLGFFFSDRPFGLPAFRLAGTVRSDPDLKAVVQGGADLLLADLKQDSGWRIRDSRNGHLLLCRAGESGGDSFSVYNPVSRRLVTIPDRPHDRVDYFADCLLLDFDGSFRVVSVQQHRGSIRAVEYDPGARRWRSHPSESPWALDRPKKLKPWCVEPMQAAGLIFWRYSAALALVLDCSSMRFSTCPVPGSCYAIGEVEDGVGCLVCLDDPTNLTTHGVLKVWLLNTGGETITWELTRKTVTVREVLGPDTRVCQVVLVSNGLALISMDDRYDQFVIDLNKLSLHAEFDFRGRAYPYQMEWPPARLPVLQEEAQPVQLVLPVKPAAPLHDVDVAAPIDHVDVAAPFDNVGLAPQLNHVDVAAPIDDVAYTEICAEGPSAVVLRPLEEHVIAAEANNLVGTVEDGVRLMETEAAASSADLVKGMALSSSTSVVPHANLGALSTQQPTTALDEYLQEDAHSNWFCRTCPGECHKTTCPQHGALPTKPRCEGVISSFRVDPPLVPAPCFPPMSPASNNHSPTQFFDEATGTQKVKSEAMYAQKVKNSKEPPDMESDDHTHTPVDENQNLNQGHASLTVVQPVSTLADSEGPLAVTQRERRSRQESKRYPSRDWVIG